MEIIRILVVLDFVRVPEFPSFPLGTIGRSAAPFARIRPVIRAIPGVALVPRGATVRWEVMNTTPLQYSNAESVWASPLKSTFLRWDIYFEKNTPFKRNERLLSINTQARITEDQHAQHHGNVNSEPADQDGEFKYGLRVRDPNSDEPIADEDPILIVRSF